MWRDKTKFELWKAPEQSSLLDGLQFFEILPKDNKSWTHCPSQIWSDFPRVFNRCQPHARTASACSCWRSQWQCWDCHWNRGVDAHVSMSVMSTGDLYMILCHSAQVLWVEWHVVGFFDTCHVTHTFLDHQNKLNKFGWFEVDGQVPVDALRTFLRSAVSQKFDVSWCLGSRIFWLGILEVKTLSWDSFSLVFISTILQNRKSKRQPDLW